MPELEADGGFQEYRDQIDRIDTEILDLVNRRIECARSIGELKGRSGTPDYYRPEREAQVLNRLVAHNRGPLDRAAVAQLFREIISLGRSAEIGLTAAYLGPDGSYSHAAALKHFGRSVRGAAQASIDEVFRAVESGAADYGVVPVENSFEGGVTNTLDRFVDTPLRICGENLLRVRHCLLSRAPDLSSVDRVLGHNQALAQCRQWLASNLPQATAFAASSSSEAARQASEDPTAAAIAGESAAALYAMPLLAQNIEDSPGNTTRFLVIGALDPAPSGADKTSLVLSARNRAGALYRLLQPLAEHGVSMTRIESRPSRKGLWEYVFFIDLEGHIRDQKVARAFARLEAEASLVKLLGSYPRAVP